MNDKKMYLSIINIFLIEMFHIIFYINNIL